MKKALCVLLALAMTLAVCPAAFAAAGEVVIDGIQANDGSVGVIVTVTGDLSSPGQVFLAEYCDSALVAKYSPVEEFSTQMGQYYYTFEGVTVSDTATLRAFVWEDSTLQPYGASLTYQEDGIIHLLGNYAIANGIDGVEVSGSTVTITAAGDYMIEGNLNGQILVNLPSKSDVANITLAGVDVTTADGPAFYASQGKINITLSDDSENTFTDNAERTVTKPSAAFYSKRDMTINGGGKLVVNGNYNNGLVCDADLTLASGAFVINAANNGIKGEDSVTVYGGDYTVVSGGDCIKSDNIAEAGSGVVSIYDGTFNLTSNESEGIQADITLNVIGGVFKINAAGDGLTANAQTADGAIEDGAVSVTGGRFDITSGGDGIKAIDGVYIESSDDASVLLDIDAGDDGIQSDVEIFITGPGEHTIAAKSLILNAPTVVVGDYCTINGETDVDIINAGSGEGDDDTDADADADSDADSDSDGDGIIHLLGDSINADGVDGATVSGTTVTITAAGEYTIDGTLSDGQILVALPAKTDEAEITLSGVSVYCSNGAPFYASQGKIKIILAAGTENTFTDNASRTVTAPKAAFYSKRDLTVKGTGTLVVNGNYNNGLVSDADLKLKNGTYVITAANNGIKGEDSVTVEDGSYTVTSVGDCIKSDNLVEEGNGTVTIEGGTFDLTTTTDGDGIQADLALIINGGDFTINAKAEGIKCNGAVNDATEPALSDGYVCVNGGKLSITAAEDGIKATDAIYVTGDEIYLDVVDDCFQADNAVYIYGGDIEAYSDSKMIKAPVIEMTGGTVKGESATDGFIAKTDDTHESALITVSGAALDIKTGEDGLKAYGDINITDSTVTLDSYLDAIQSETASVNIAGASVLSIKSGGGTAGTVTNYSQKGIKAFTEINISGGTIDLNCKDDAIHSDNNVTISGGAITARSSDDGVHANNILTVSDDADVSVAQSYEGYEGYVINVNGGTTHITASDDGINAAGVGETDYTDGSVIYASKGSSYRSAGTSYYTTSALSGSFDIEFTWCGTDCVDSGILFGSANTYRSSSNMFQDSAICILVDSSAIYTRTSAKTQVAAYTKKQEYAIKISVNTTSQTYDLYIDGVLAAANVAFRKSMTSIDAAVFTDNGGVSNAYYVKDANIDLTEVAASSSGGPGGPGGGFGPGGGGMDSGNKGTLNISGGYLYVNSVGDGLDANGDINITGGTVIVDGPTSNGDTAIDFDGNCYFKGGFLVAVGSSGMIETPSSSSTQPGMVVKFSQAKSAGTLVRVTDSSGNEIFTFKPAKSYSAMIVTSPEFLRGSSYKIYSGGSDGASSTDGLYEKGGTYSGGSSKSVTLSNMITSTTY